MGHQNEMAPKQGSEPSDELHKLSSLIADEFQKKETQMNKTTIEDKQFIETLFKVVTDDKLVQTNRQWEVHTSIQTEEIPGKNKLTQTKRRESKSKVCQRVWGSI